MDAIHVINGTVIVQPIDDFGSILISIVTAIILGITLIITIVVTRQNNKERYTNTLTLLDHDFTVLLKDIPKKAETADCEKFAVHFLNQLDRISYLNKNRKIPDDMISYFKLAFSYGHNLIKWYQITGLTDEKIRKYWTSLIEWYEDNKLESMAMNSLPEALRDYAKKTLQHALKGKTITQEQFDEKIKILES